VIFESGLSALGSYIRLLRTALREALNSGIDLRETLTQIRKIGLNSLPIVALTAIFTGMVLALQTAYGLNRFGAKNYVGNITSLGFIRELGPVLTAIMLCGRVGAGIAAEIASMVATEQVDALRALGGSPTRKLMTPRIVAGLITLPVLTTFANFVGIYGAGLVAIYDLGITSHQFYHSILYTVVIRDIMDGTIKSFFFGFLVISIACYKGLRTSGGTEGVGLTTTSAVVTGSIVILVSDFFMTKVLILLHF
jgi:phospholipid/cholesterol/gamma-HCH transport system permease protein